MLHAHLKCKVTDQLLTMRSAKLVDMALASGKIYEGEGFKYIQQSFENGTLHLIGLLSDGGVHSRIDQLQVDIIKFQIPSVDQL